MTDLVAATLDELVDLARQLATDGRRRLLGIAGAPGAGKTVVAAHVADVLGPGLARTVGLDGFHLAGAELHRLGRHERKGAPDTFDAEGYVALLRRLRAAAEPVVYAPRFDRGLEESIAGAVPVPAEVPLVITEGNYLLLPERPWGEVRGLLDECWYVDPGEQARLARLAARHEAYGRTADQARERSLGSDQRNAELVAATRSRADLVVRVASVPGLPART